MSQNGAGTRAASNSSTPQQQLSSKDCEYNPPLSKADLDASLSAVYEKSTNALTQEIANIGSRTDILETKHDKLSLAHSDLWRDYETLADSFSYMQAHVEDLDNRNRRNNIRVRGIPESITELFPAGPLLLHIVIQEIREDGANLLKIRIKGIFVFPFFFLFIFFKEVSGGQLLEQYNLIDFAYSHLNYLILVHCP